MRLQAVTVTAKEVSSSEKSGFPFFDSLGYTGRKGIG